MTLVGKSVLFRLSPEGQQALRELFPAKGSFFAHVVEEDALGVWVSTPEQAGDDSEQVTPVTLLKWQYLWTAVIDWRPERPRVPVKVGFL
jgi:hypothetical protein